MGGIKNTIKAGASNALNHITNSVNITDINTKLTDVQSKLDIPDLQVPDKIKNLKPNINFDKLKVPDANNYIQPVKDKLSSLTSNIELPAEVGGFKIPELPDMSSLTDKANGYLSDSGLSIKSGLNFSDIKNAVTKSDFSNLIEFKGLDIGIDPHSIQHVSDGTIKSLDTFDMSETQQQIDELTKEAGMEHIDISQFF